MTEVEQAGGHRLKGGASRSGGGNAGYCDPRTAAGRRIGKRWFCARASASKGRPPDPGLPTEGFVDPSVYDGSIPRLRRTRSFASGGGAVPISTLSPSNMVLVYQNAVARISVIAIRARDLNLVMHRAVALMSGNPTCSPLRGGRGWSVTALSAFEATCTPTDRVPAGMCSPA